jgi:hypothetical protein
MLSASRNQSPLLSLSKSCWLLVIDMDRVPNMPRWQAGWDQRWRVRVCAGRWLRVSDFLKLKHLFQSFQAVLSALHKRVHVITRSQRPRSQSAKPINITTVKTPTLLKYSSTLFTLVKEFDPGGAQFRNDFLQLKL